MTRTEARELAFFIVFEHSFSGETVEAIIENSSMARDVNVPDFSKRLAEGVISKIQDLDDLISSHLTGWTVERISKVSLAIMRVAIYEIIYSEDVPVSVSINEAVNLCKVYAGEEEYTFVNGVLGAIAREVGNKGD